jgi:hypothetical protein
MHQAVTSAMSCPTGKDYPAITDFVLSAMLRTVARRSVSLSGASRPVVHQWCAPRCAHSTTGVTATTDDGGLREACAKVTAALKAKRPQRPEDIPGFEIRVAGVDDVSRLDRSARACHGGCVSSMVLRSVATVAERGSRGGSPLRCCAACLAVEVDDGDDSAGGVEQVPAGHVRHPHHRPRPLLRRNSGWPSRRFDVRTCVQGQHPFVWLHVRMLLWAFIGSVPTSVPSLDRNWYDSSLVASAPSAVAALVCRRRASCGGSFTV